MQLGGCLIFILLTCCILRGDKNRVFHFFFFAYLPVFLCGSMLNPSDFTFRPDVGLYFKVTT